MQGGGGGLEIDFLTCEAAVRASSYCFTTFKQLSYERNKEKKYLL